MDNIIDLTPDNKALFDALMRVVAASWPRRDESAEDILVNAIQELVKLRELYGSVRPIVEGAYNYWLKTAAPFNVPADWAAHAEEWLAINPAPESESD